MSKRHSESSINPKTAAKHIRSSSGKKLANVSMHYPIDLHKSVIAMTMTLRWCTMYLIQKRFHLRSSA